jgi:hypothetical protein
MAPEQPRHPTLDPIVARKTWRTVEPLHGMIYFAPEAVESYARLGIRQQAGYFASRSAPMGAVGADTVIATFFNFHPDLVRDAVSGVWNIAAPADVLAARVEAAGSALRRMLGDAADGPEVARAATLARQAAEAASDHLAGRPLFAGHVDLPWPDEPLLTLWHAQTLLREFRGDGHIAALVTHGIGPVDALVMHVASGEVAEGFIRDTRGWSDEEWGSGVERLAARGWLDQGATGGAAPTLSEEGASVRHKVEVLTDRLSLAAYEVLGEEGCDELRILARPLSKTVVAAAGFGA